MSFIIPFSFITIMLSSTLSSYNCHHVASCCSSHPAPSHPPLSIYSIYPESRTSKWLCQMLNVGKGPSSGVNTSFKCSFNCSGRMNLHKFNVRNRDTNLWGLPKIKTWDAMTEHDRPLFTDNSGTQVFTTRPISPSHFLLWLSTYIHRCVCLYEVCMLLWRVKFNWVVLLQMDITGHQTSNKSNINICYTSIWVWR